MKNVMPNYVLIFNETFFMKNKMFLGHSRLWFNTSQFVSFFLPCHTNICSMGKTYSLVLGDPS